MSKYARVFALIKQLNANGLSITYQDAVRDVTNGRTESLSSLSHHEVTELTVRLQRMVQKEPYNMPAGDEDRDKMRKAIISAFKSVGKTTDDAKAWAEKYGVNGVKKGFNEYTKAELFLLIRNANKAAADFNKAVNK